MNETETKHLEFRVRRASIVWSVFAGLCVFARNADCKTCLAQRRKVPRRRKGVFTVSALSGIWDSLAKD
jgi:hypothetical protein